MIDKRSQLLAVLRLAAAVCLGAAALPAAADALPAWLSRVAPAANPGVLKLALRATSCAVEQGLPASDRLAVIDYSVASTQPRMWVFDLPHHKLLYKELVAHGRNSGQNYATHFSNAAGSLESSLGLFRTMNTYFGRDGYSLRLEGLEAGVNDKAYDRDIVIHGADYVNVALARSQGRIGRSFGCPAVRRAVAPQLIDAMKGGQFVFAYYPQQQWLKSSPYLHCDGTQIAAASD